MSRRIVAAICDGANLSGALQALEMLGVPSTEVVRVEGVAALRRLRGRDRDRVDGAAALRAAVHERALRGGGTLLLVPVGDEVAEKRVSLVLLRHSEGPVEVRDEE